MNKQLITHYYLLGKRDAYKEIRPVIRQLEEEVERLEKGVKKQGEGICLRCGETVLSIRGEEEKEENV